MRPVHIAILAAFALTCWLAALSVRAETPGQFVVPGGKNALKPVYACDYTKGAFCGGEAFSVAGNRMMTDGTTNCGGSGCLTWGPNNLLTYSNTFSNAAWTTYNTTVSTTSSTLDPLGGNNAWHLAETNTANTYHQIADNFSGSAGNKLSYTYYVKSAEWSTGTILLSDNSNNFIFCQFDVSAGTIGSVQTVGGGWSGYGCDIVPLANSWYAVNIYGVFNASSTMRAWMEITNAGVRQYTGTTGFGLYVYNSVVSLITYEFAPRSSDLALAPTTSAQAFGPRFDYTGGFARGMLYEPVSATNIVTYSNDLTNAAWTKSNITAALTQTGPDGVANGASSITASAGNGTVCNAQTLASSQRLLSAYLKRLTGSGEIDMSTDGGSTWNNVTSSIGASWARVSAAAQTVTNPSTCFRIVTNGDAVAVDYVDNETGSAATSPILVRASAVTRSPETLVAQGALASASAVGPVAMSVTSEATGITTCTQSLAGAFAFPANDNWIRSIKAYPPGTPLAKAAC